MSLMAQVEQARNRHQESNQQLLAASGVAKGIAAAAWIENRRLSQLPPLTPLEERMRYGTKPSFRASIAAGRINERVWMEHLKRRAESEGGRVVTEAAWKDPATGKNMTFPGAKSRRLDDVYIHPNGNTDALELKNSSLTAASRGAQAQQARDQTAMSRGAQLGKNTEGFLSDVDNVTYKQGLPLYGPGGNTDLPGAGERATHVHIEPRDGGRSVLRGAGKALGPLGVALDAYSLKEAWDADGGKVGENVTSTAGGVAGGWAGAAAGAAIGSAAGPVGTVVGGVIGGVIGSGVGSKVAEGIGNLFD